MDSLAAGLWGVWRGEERVEVVKENRGSRSGGAAGEGAGGREGAGGKGSAKEPQEEWGGWV